MPEFVLAHRSGRQIAGLGGWMQFTGKSAEQLGDYDKLPAVHPEDREIYRQAWAKGIATRSKIEFSARIRAMTAPIRGSSAASSRSSIQKAISPSGMVFPGRLSTSRSRDKPSRFEARHFRAARPFSISPRRNWRTCPRSLSPPCGDWKPTSSRSNRKASRGQEGSASEGHSIRPHARRTYHCRVGLGRLEPCSRRSRLELKYSYCGARAALPAQGPPQRQALASHQGGAPHPYLRRLRKPPPRLRILDLEHIFPSPSTCICTAQAV